ncbi:MAG: hypothetical protein A2W26_04785 [Acidobacteria bacterium RBG_16_64_8]|nr:MAG: hypothetical protein A2W26_04785 [Acidobacteria bacterium RBG_16_64_8]
MGEQRHHALYLADADVARVRWADGRRQYGHSGVVLIDAVLEYLPAYLLLRQHQVRYAALYRDVHEDGDIAETKIKIHQGYAFASTGQSGS